MRNVYQALLRAAPATKLSIFAALIALANPWAGLVVGLASAWLYTRNHSFDFKRHLAAWYFTPVAIAIAYLGFGESLPSDDLMRHLSAWQLGFDYRSQYPWSDIPKADLWLGYDYLLGLLQRGGLSKSFLLQWLPGLCIALQAIVLFGALKRVLPRHRRHPELFLLVGALGLVLMTPRSLLGRPEMFLLVFGASAWLCQKPWQVRAWIAGFIALIPCYWLGWVYAPFAFLLGPKTRSLAAGLSLTVTLGALHLVFWQGYTGDYAGLMHWLKGTLSVLAGENNPVLYGLHLWPFWLFTGVLSFALSTLNLSRIKTATPVLLLMVWFVLPNQIRYVASLSFVTLPWLYRTFALAAHARKIEIPAMAVILGLAVAAALSVYPTDSHPKFALGAHARVYSESPYAAVFYGQPGIAVEPSFALGATRPEWRELAKDGTLRCDLLVRGGFTHVIEKSQVKPLKCAELTAVQGAWRLWTLKKD